MRDKDGNVTTKADIAPWKFVVEKIPQDTAAPGISPAKLKIIRFFSGIAGDGAGSLTSLITRTFGGIHIGFVVLGKISVGDNDTLAKIVETAVDNVAARSSELFVSQLLYDVTYPATQPKPQQGDAPLVVLLKVITTFDGENND